jgi:uncharacterized protein
VRKKPDPLGPRPIELRTHGSIREIGEAAWRSLEDGETPPFLAFDWLDALEQTGCVKPERGWLPLYLSLYSDSELVAAAPAYVKGNSEGEFVFDHAWARFATDRLRLDYYPKLVVAVPFTPATGPRLLVRPGFDRKPLLAAFAAGLRAVVERLGLSGAHVLFPSAGDTEELVGAGFAARHGLQFHWHNAGYASFDDFLARFDSKRRNQIRRERRELEKQGTRVETLTGRDLNGEIVDHVFEFYSSTVNKYFWGRQYLNREFFEAVCGTMPERLHVVLARDAASKRPVAGAFNLLGPRALYGRYWGAREERPFLHFNVCFYHAIEDAILRKLELFEPGAGGEHKLARGFEPSVTYSAHHLADRRLAHAVADFVDRERQAIAEHVAEAQRSGVLRALREGP